MEEKIKSSGTPEAQYELIFKNGALANLKRLAAQFNVPESDLRQVINKGIQMLSLIKSLDTKNVILETKKGEKFVLDAEKI